LFVDETLKSKGRTNGDTLPQPQIQDAFVFRNMKMSDAIRRDHPVAMGERIARLTRGAPDDLTGKVSAEDGKIANYPETAAFPVV
jgi:hypothetical protein